MMTQGERVKAVRKSLHLTLEGFGEKLGVTKQTVSRIENGVNNLTDQMARAICREYNVSYSWLTVEEGDMFSDLPQTILDELCRQYDLDSLDREILKMYLELSKHERDCLKAKIRELYKKIGPLQSEEDPKAQAVQPVALHELSIDEKVALYRKELELEEEAAAKSEASQPGA